MSVQFSKREKQALLSLIEEVYQVENAPSFMQALHISLKQTRFSVEQPPSDGELFRILKNKYGPPTGRISRVVTKQVYNSYSKTETDLGLHLKNNIEKETDSQIEAVSDDMLCQIMRQ